MTDTIVIAGLKEQRDWMASLRKDYLSGVRKIGELRDGRQIDQTEQEIEDLTRRIDGLDRLIAAYERRSA